MFILLGSISNTYTRINTLLTKQQTKRNYCDPTF